jgi:hypothetical protein
VRGYAPVAIAIVVRIGWTNELAANRIDVKPFFAPI